MYMCMKSKQNFFDDFQENTLGYDDNNFRQT